MSDYTCHQESFRTCRITRVIRSPSERVRLHVSSGVLQNMSDTQRRDISPNMRYRIMFKAPILKQVKSVHALATDILILSYRHGTSTSSK
jgi:hypothetical protein